MKTLNQILEGTVEMSDYKLDKKGRKYKAHRMSMGDGMKESANPHNVEQIVENPTTIKQQSGSDRAYDVTHKATGKKIGTVYTPGKTNPNHVASVNGLDGSPFKSKEFSNFRDAHNFIKQSRGIDEASDQETMNAERSKVLARFIKSATPKNGQVVDNVDTSREVSEARGRPAGAATLAKRAAAASKPREDDDEGEHYEADSGVEADQHIHVQLKKAADSDQKPFEVSFKNGKKHTVSQKVAKDILSATERLKPEHRKNVHDEIHHSYDNLMSVHRLVARK